MEINIFVEYSDACQHVNACIISIKGDLKEIIASLHGNK